MDRTKKNSTRLSSLGHGQFGTIATDAFFYGIPPNLAGALLVASEEQRYWSLAKAQGSSSFEPVYSQ
jgi:hypothetical protein